MAVAVVLLALVALVGHFQFHPKRKTSYKAQVLAYVSDMTYYGTVFIYSLHVSNLQMASIAVVSAFLLLVLIGMVLPAKA